MAQEQWSRVQHSFSKQFIHSLWLMQSNTKNKTNHVLGIQHYLQKLKENTAQYHRVYLFIDCDYIMSPLLGQFNCHLSRILYIP